MLVNQYVQKGDKFEYTASGNVAYHGIVVVGSLVGVATKAAVSGDVISCDAVGVFALEKTANEAITQGTVVYVTSAGKITATSSSNTKVGIAWAAAAAGDATVLVKLG